MFRQTVLKRALLGAEAAGIEIARIEISKHGVIVVVPGKHAEDADDRSRATHTVIVK